MSQAEREYYIEVKLGGLDLCRISTKVCLEIDLFLDSSMLLLSSAFRYQHLWLLVGCVVCIKNGNIWDPSRSYRVLPLPCPKNLWEAPTQAAWEAEYEVCQMSQTTHLSTLGDLIDAQQSEHTPWNARKLDQWNAGVDNLGCLLNLVGSME